MLEFSKEKICRQLAQFKVPTEPSLELRKMISLSLDNKGNFFLLNKHVLFSIFEPPENYCAHIQTPLNHFSLDIHLYAYYNCISNAQKLKTDEYTIDCLSREDECLLRKIFGTNVFDSNKFTSHEYLNEIVNFNRILNSPDEFIAHCDIFNKSEIKPEWDLIRILVADTQSNYQDRQKIYEQLLNGGLDDLINRGEIEKKGDYYSFAKINQNIYLNNHNNGSNELACPVSMFATFGKDISDYIHRNKQDKELQKIKLCQQYNDIIREALYKGELPVHRTPSFQIIELDDKTYKSDDCVILWSEVKLLLESKTGQKTYNAPIFDKFFLKTIEQKTENTDKTGADTSEIEINTQKSVNPWDVPNQNDPKPEQPWYVAARYFARQLVKDDSTLLVKKGLLAQKVVASLDDVGIKKRGGKDRFSSGTIKKAFSKINFS